MTQSKIHYLVRLLKKNKMVKIDQICNMMHITYNDIDIFQTKFKNFVTIIRWNSNPYGWLVLNSYKKENENEIRK